jgi:hypothetical protein
MRDELLESGLDSVGRRMGRRQGHQWTNRGALVALVGLTAICSCAKTPTVIVATVNIDATVPPLMQIRTIVTRPTDPLESVSNMLSSLFRGDAADRPAPYPFPMLVSIAVPPAWPTGTVQVTIEGLDWDTNAVNATGSTSAEVDPGNVTQAALTLTAVSIIDGTDAGTGDDSGAGGDDAAVSDDAASDDVIAGI